MCVCDVYTRTEAVEERGFRNEIYGMEALKKPLTSEEDSMEYNEVYHGEKEKAVENEYGNVGESHYHYVRY